MSIAGVVGVLAGQFCGYLAGEFLGELFGEFVMEASVSEKRRGVDSG